MKWICILLLLIVESPGFSQNKTDSNYLAWSSKRRLTVTDFEIRIAGEKTSPSFAQFYIDYRTGPVDFMKKNFNDKVHTYFIRSASWIDTTISMNISLRYQQTLFDLSEVYARQFRKQLKANKKKSLYNDTYGKTLDAEIMTSFSKRRI